MLKYFVPTLFFFFSLYASEFEEFYILPMGQGNAQLIIYHDGSNKVGVLYDLGSKSLQMHPKFASRGEWNPNFLVKDSNISKRKSIRRNIDFDVVSSPPPKANITTTHVAPFSTNAKMSIAQREGVKNELQKFVYEKLSGLKHLFIFLSHSDEDHINFISNETIPVDVPITVFLSGDWFGNIGCKEGATNFTEPAIKVITFLKDRIQNNSENTHFNFPYYNNFYIVKSKDIPKITITSKTHEAQVAISKTKRFSVFSLKDDVDSVKIDFNTFIRDKLTQAARNREELSEEALNQLSEYCSRTNLNTPNPRFFSGSFANLYNLSFKVSVENMPNFDALMNGVVNNIYIWSLNHQTDDINGHSIILSCRLQSLNMSVILTGDAQHSVFQRIVSEYSDRVKDFRQFLGLDDGHIVTLMLPHHGSRENSSGSALSFFTPDVFGISAGDGGQYGHPSLSLIQNIDNMYRMEKTNDNFTQKYLLRKSLDFIAMYQKRHIPKQTGELYFPFLCPNLYGCIKWDKNGIYTNFENTISVNESRYMIMFLSHVWEADKSILKGMVKKGNVNVYSSEDITQNTTMKVIIQPSEVENSNYSCVLKNKENELFAGVTVGDRVYFYKLIRAS